MYWLLCFNGQYGALDYDRVGHCVNPPIAMYMHNVHRQGDPIGQRRSDICAVQYIASKKVSVRPDVPSCT